MTEKVERENISESLQSAHASASWLGEESAYSDTELEYGYGTSLLMSVRTAYFFLLVRWVVSGEMMRVGPVSARHTVADLAVLVQRKLGVEVSRQRMTFRGNLLSLGTRLGRLGLVNEHVPDPVLLSQVDEAVFLEKDGGAGQRADLKSVGEKLVF